jgi:MraZ protein
MPFVFHYDKMLDEKNRLQIPSEFRSTMDPETDGDSFYLCPGERDNTLSLYPNKLWEAMVKELRTRRLPVQQAVAFEEWYYSLCCRLDMDPQGRIVLPKWQLERVKLGKEITLAGANDRIEVWRTSDHREFLEAPTSVPLARRSPWPTLQTYRRMADSGWKDPNPSSSP